MIFNPENLELIKKVPFAEKELTEWSKNSLEKLIKQGNLSQSILEYYEKRIKNKEFSNDVRSFRLDSKGEKLIISTSRGIFVYDWMDLIQSSQNECNPEVFIPSPKMEFDSIVYCYSLELDEETNTVLYSTSNGLICYYDINKKESGVLVELAGKPLLSGLSISRKNKVLICNCGYRGEDLRNESPSILVFKYP